MKTCSHAKFQVKSCYRYWVMLLHEEAEAEEADEDEEFVKSCFTCIPYLVWHFHPIFCMQLLFYMFFTLMPLKDRLRLKLKVKTKISLCMAIMLDNPWQSLYTQYYRTVWLKKALWMWSPRFKVCVTVSILLAFSRCREYSLVHHLTMFHVDSMLAITLYPVQLCWRDESGVLGRSCFLEASFAVLQLKSGVRHLQVYNKSFKNALVPLIILTIHTIVALFQRYIVFLIVSVWLHTDPRLTPFTQILQKLPCDCIIKKVLFSDIPPKKDESTSHYDNGKN